MDNNIASERTKLKLSQEELGSLMNIPIEVVRGWENGSTDIGYSQAAQLAKLFGCSLDYLMCRSEDRLSHRRELVYSAIGFPK